MKMIDDVIIIGIDSGYGNIKTANCCFPASLSAYDREPVFKENLLVFEGKFYLIGEGHKEFLADKTKDLDYYVLALAAIARELNIRKMTCGKIRIAAGLPLTWVSGQRDEFRDYLLQNKAVDFSFRNVSYHVEIVGVDVFPQGFAAVADRLSDFRGVNMICDIGNGTMNIMFINDKKPVSGNMFTEKYDYTPRRGQICKRTGLTPSSILLGGIQNEKENPWNHHRFRTRRGSDLLQRHVYASVSGCQEQQGSI